MQREKFFNELHLIFSDHMIFDIDVINSADTYINISVLLDEIYEYADIKMLENNLYEDNIDDFFLFYKKIFYAPNGIAREILNIDASEKLIQYCFTKLYAMLYKKYLYISKNTNNKIYLTGDEAIDIAALIKKFFFHINNGNDSTNILLGKNSVTMHNQQIPTKLQKNKSDVYNNAISHYVNALIMLYQIQSISSLRNKTIAAISYAKGLILFNIALLRHNSHDHNIIDIKQQLKTIYEYQSLECNLIHFCKLSKYDLLQLALEKTYIAREEISDYCIQHQKKNLLSYIYKLQASLYVEIYNFDHNNEYLLAKDKLLGAISLIQDEDLFEDFVQIFDELVKSCERDNKYRDAIIYIDELIEISLSLFSNRTSKVSEMYIRRGEIILEELRYTSSDISTDLYLYLLTFAKISYEEAYKLDNTNNNALLCIEYVNQLLAINNRHSMA